MTEAEKYSLSAHQAYGRYERRYCSASNSMIFLDSLNISMHALAECFPDELRPLLQN
jgi:hypothetical protein